MSKFFGVVLSLLVIFSIMAIVGPAPPVSAKPMDEYSVLVLKNTDAWGFPPLRCEHS